MLQFVFMIMLSELGNEMREARAEAGKEELPPALFTFTALVVFIYDIFEYILRGLIESSLKYEVIEYGDGRESGKSTRSDTLNAKIGSALENREIGTTNGS